MSSTIKQIAKQYGKTDRTVRAWLEKARTEHEGLGTFENGHLSFSDEEVEILKGYGRDIPDKSVPIADVIEPELIDGSVNIIPGQVVSAGQIVRFDIEPVSLATQQVDFTDLDIAADRYTESIENAMMGLGQIMAQSLKNKINLAIAQNDVAVKAMQAHAANQAIQKLGESQGHTGLIQ